MATPNSTKSEKRDLTDGYEQSVDGHMEGDCDFFRPVVFGTSGHRGNAADGSFNGAHIRAITRAIAEWRRDRGYLGPVFIGKDTHALSAPAMDTVVQVLSEMGVSACVDVKGRFTPTPLISRAILAHNSAAPDALADGIILTPSHNPPEDGGIKYNGPDGGPASADATSWIEKRANELLKVDDALANPASSSAQRVDYVEDYVSQLAAVVNMEAIAASGVSIGVDPLGGAALDVWDAIAVQYGLKLDVVNRDQSPDFAFMPPDHDGKIRMDCSSPAAMANVLARKDEYDLMFGNDPDADRHGIVDADGLMNPNHYLAVCIDYLLRHRPHWGKDLAVGKTLVSSSMIDRVVASHGRKLFEVPVGFKWFVEGLYRGDICFAGEESAGASLLTMSGRPWSTDKDGIVLCLLAAEIYAVTGVTPNAYYRQLAERFGEIWYRRVDRPAREAVINRLKSMSSASLAGFDFGGDRVARVETTASGNGASIGGIKVTTRNGWVAMRPSGTEPLYKIYGESFTGVAHLDALLTDAEKAIGASSGL